MAPYTQLFYQTLWPGSSDTPAHVVPLLWCGWTGFNQERAPAVASDAGEGILCTGGALGAGAVGWAHSARAEITDFLGTTRFVKTHRGYQGYWKI